MSPLCVLIVDDDRNQTLTQLVRKWGYEVHTASDAQDAVVMARAFPPDVIFLDIGPPEKDGLAECLRTISPHGEALVFAMTGSLEVERRSYLRAGIKEYFLKPVDPVFLELLLSIRSKVLGKTHVTVPS